MPGLVAVPLPGLVAVPAFSHMLTAMDRARYLHVIEDPLVWDEAVAALRGPGMDDPLRVMAIVNPGALRAKQLADDRAAGSDAWVGLDDGKGPRVI